MGMKKFKKIVITFNIDSEKHMEQVKNISHLETMFGKRKFIHIKFIPIFYSCVVFTDITKRWEFQLEMLDFSIYYTVWYKSERWKFQIQLNPKMMENFNWKLKLMMLYATHRTFTNGKSQMILLFRRFMSTTKSVLQFLVNYENWSFGNFRTTNNNGITFLTITK